MRLFALLAAIVLLPGLALAQETVVALPETLVGFVFQTLFLIVSAILAVLVPLVMTRLFQKFGLQVEQEKRDALQATLTNAAGGLLQRLGAEAMKLRVDMRNPAIADAVNRALKGAPDAIKWAGLSEEEIARRILEKLPQIAPPTPAAADVPAPDPLIGPDPNFNLT